MRHPIKALFFRHRQNARQRGIAFHFTYDEWCTWWESKLGPDWVKKRGVKRGQYVMARFKDAGSYVVTNVECLEAQENTRQRHLLKPKRGESHHRSKLTNKDVFFIRSSNLTDDELSKMFPVTVETIASIKARRKWSHL